MKIYKSKNIVEHKIDDETVIYVTLNDSIVNIDAIGTILWELIGDGIEFDELVNRFYSCFEEKPSYDVFLDEVDEILSSYIKAGLVQYIDIEEQRSDDC